MQLDNENDFIKCRSNEEVNDLISTHNLDFTFLTKTWLDRNGAVVLIETASPNFKLIQTTRSDKRGNAIAAVFSSIYSCKEIPPWGIHVFLNTLVYR